MTNRWFRFQRFNLYRLRISVRTKSKSTKKHCKHAEIGNNFVQKEEAINQLKKQGSIYQQIKGVSIHKMARHIQVLFQDRLPLGLYFGVTYTTWWIIGLIFSKQCAWIYGISFKQIQSIYWRELCRRILVWNRKFEERCIHVLVKHTCSALANWWHLHVLTSPGFTLSLIYKH